MDGRQEMGGDGEEGEQERVDEVMVMTTRERREV